MARAWIIGDAFDIASEQKTLWSNKWKKNTAVATKSLIILDLVKMVAQT